MKLCARSKDSWFICFNLNHYRDWEFTCTNQHNQDKDKGTQSNHQENMHISKHSQDIQLYFIVTTQIYRVWEYLSISDCIQLPDCGCSPFHPTIGSKAFILSTLDTPVPSHDITRELYHFSETFSLSQHPCEVYQMLPRHQARNLPLFFWMSGTCIPLCSSVLI